VKPQPGGAGSGTLRIVSRRRRWLAAALAAALVCGAVMAAVVWMFTAGSGGSDQALVARANIVAALAGLLALLAVLGGVSLGRPTQARPRDTGPGPA
jgi:hypothetical protein